MRNDVLTEDKHLQIIQNYHAGKTNHRSIDYLCETKLRIKNLYYWLNLRKAIQNYINQWKPIAF